MAIIVDKKIFPPLFITRNQGLWVSLVVFLLAVVSQSLLWNMMPIMDRPFWVDGINNFAAGVFPAPDDFIFGYPGTLLLVPGAGLTWVGIDGVAAMKIVMVTILSLGATASAYICYLTKRETLWWLFVGIILSLNPFFVRATLPTALTAIVGCVVVLYTLYIVEYKSKLSEGWLVGLGVLEGFLLICRFDIGAVIIAISFVLVRYFRFRSVVLSIIIALAVAYIGTPFLYKSPVSYFLSLSEKVHQHAMLKTWSVDASFFDLYNLPNLLGSLALILGIMFLVNRSIPTPVPYCYLLSLVIVTIGYVGLLAYSHHHPNWLFLPFASMWEVMLPLFILQLGDAFFLRREQVKLIIGFVLFGHLALFCTYIILRLLR